MKINFKADSFVTLPQEWIDSLPRWGSCDTAISEIMMFNTITCDRDEAIDYLTHVGFDEPDTLNDESSDTLVSRVLWIALLDCRENQSTNWYFGM